MHKIKQAIDKYLLMAYYLPSLDKIIEVMSSSMLSWMGVGQRIGWQVGISLFFCSNDEVNESLILPLCS